MSQDRTGPASVCVGRLEQSGLLTDLTTSSVSEQQPCGVCFRQKALAFVRDYEAMRESLLGRRRQPP